MLLPSAFSCEPLSQTAPPRSLLMSAPVVSPPASPPPQFSTQNAFGTILTSCRSLQALIAAPLPSRFADAPLQQPVTPPPKSYGAALLTPPPTYILPPAPVYSLPPPPKLRLRTRKGADPAGGSSNTAGLAPSRMKITKRAAGPRGHNKRRRAMDDDEGRDENESDSDPELGEGGARAPANIFSSDAPSSPAAAELPPRPHTPKRARVAPAQLPLGLDRSDFHDLHADGVPDGSRAPGTDVEVEANGEAWSIEDDAMLVELVLERLKLSHEDWEACARTLGKRNGLNISRRWRSLVSHGDVGLRPSRRSRGKLHQTWR